MESKSVFKGKKKRSPDDFSACDSLRNASVRDTPMCNGKLYESGALFGFFSAFVHQSLRAKFSDFCICFSLTVVGYSPWGYKRVGHRLATKQFSHYSAWIP